MHSTSSGIHDVAVSPCYFLGTAGRVFNAAVHLFADASTVAYGAVAYLCLANKENIVVSSLPWCKSRIASLSGISLARLELMACLVATRILYFLRQNLQININEAYLWTDSMIALYWIIGEPTRWKQFVRNSVFEIQKSTVRRSWRHCPGSANPVDLVTRGMTAKRLLESET